MTEGLPFTGRQMVRDVPALLYRRSLGKDGAVTAALVSAGLLSVVVFPPIALSRLRHLTLAGDPMLQPNTLSHRPMGTQD